MAARKHSVPADIKEGLADDALPAPLSDGTPEPAPPARDTAVTLTSYQGWPATARVATITVPDNLKPQHWAYSIRGQEVPVVVVTYTTTHHDQPQVVNVYDGDGSGSRKFVQGGGLGKYEHMEV